MKKNIILATFALFALCASAQTDYAKLTQNLPFKMASVKAPVIPKNEVKLTDFGALGDGETLCTKAFAKAMTGDEYSSDTQDMFDIEEIKEIADYLMVYYQAHQNGD